MQDTSNDELQIASQGSEVLVKRIPLYSQPEALYRWNPYILPVPMYSHAMNCTTTGLHCLKSPVSG